MEPLVRAATVSGIAAEKTMLVGVRMVVTDVEYILIQLV